MLGTQAWWACSTGLTPCVHGTVLNHTHNFCVLIQLVPQITYHPKEVVQALTGEPGTLLRYKREPQSLTLAIILGTGLAGTGASIATLAIQSQNYNSLKADIDEDIQRLENSITHLEKNADSLAEVLFQNRRDLDLLFLQ